MSDLVTASKNIIAEGCGCDRYCEQAFGDLCGCQRDAELIIRMTLVAALSLTADILRARTTDNLDLAKAMANISNLLPPEQTQ